ncbi:MAG: GNAT family N-acetyltransferase [Bacteroidota bacterium]
MKGGYQQQTANNQDADAIIELIQQVFDEFQLGFDYPHVTSDLQNLEQAYAKGYFGLVQDPDRKLIGTFGLYPLSEKTAEIRKMYLLPEARGKGLGRQMLDLLLDKARTQGFERVELETSSAFKQAIGLYQKNGFRPKANENSCSSCNMAFYLDLG